MDTFYCRIITLGETLPRHATVQCTPSQLINTVADHLEDWEPFDVVEVRDLSDTLLITIAGDKFAFSN